MQEFSIEQINNRIREIDFFKTHKFTRVEITGSTNDDLKRQVCAGIFNEILVADQQSQGRGQFERIWHSDPCQALLFSFSGMQIPDVLPLSLLLGVAVAKAIVEISGAEVWLKWPNDIYLGQGKLGGILVENIFAGEKSTFVAGIGVNLRQPSKIGNATSLEKFNLNSMALLLKILTAFDQLVRLEKEEQAKYWENYAGKFWQSHFLCSEYSQNQEPSLVKPVSLNGDGSLNVLVEGQAKCLRSARLELFS